MPRQRRLPPDLRPSWRDPNMPVMRDYKMGDGSVRTIVDPDYEHRYREMLMETTRLPSWRQDPNSNPSTPSSARSTLTNSGANTMSEPFSTIGGIATKDEAYRKLMYHLEESINQCLVIGHLYNTEDDNRSKLLAKGWYGIGNEMLPMMKEQIRQIAMARMQ